MGGWNGGMGMVEVVEKLMTVTSKDIFYYYLLSHDSFISCSMCIKIFLSCRKHSLIVNFFLKFRNLQTRTSI